MSVFSFIDNVSEVEKGQSITAFFTLKGDEEFLLDHFEGFPVMPGVLLLESLKQAAQALLLRSAGNGTAYRLSELKEAKFGQFVKPGGKLQLSVKLVHREDSRADFEGRVNLTGDGTPGPRVLQASFSLVPVGEK